MPELVEEAMEVDSTKNVEDNLNVESDDNKKIEVESTSSENGITSSVSEIQTNSEKQDNRISDNEVINEGKVEGEDQKSNELRKVDVEKGRENDESNENNSNQAESSTNSPLNIVDKDENNSIDVKDKPELSNVEEEKSTETNEKLQKKSDNDDNNTETCEVKQNFNINSPGSNKESKVTSSDSKEDDSSIEKQPDNKQSLEENMKNNVTSTENTKDSEKMKEDKIKIENTVEVKETENESEIESRSVNSKLTKNGVDSSIESNEKFNKFDWTDEADELPISGENILNLPLLNDITDCINSGGGLLDDQLDDGQEMPWPDVTKYTPAQCSSVDLVMKFKKNPEKMRCLSSILHGKLTYDNCKFEEAAEILSKSCVRVDEVFGQNTENCADVYYLYGCALLELGKGQVVGDAIKENTANILNSEGEDDDDDDDDDDEDNNEVASSEQVNGEKEVNHKENGVVNEMEDENEVEAEVEKDGTEGENGDEKEENEEAATSSENKDTTIANENDIGNNDDDEESDLRTSWEVLEVAKSIYSKYNKKEKVGFTLLKLGEVGLEENVISQAIEDTKNAVEIFRKMEKPNHDATASGLFQLGLAYSAYNLFDESIKCFTESKELLESVLNDKKDELEKAVNYRQIPYIQKDIDDKLSMISDIEEKITDMQETARSAQEKTNKDDEEMNPVAKPGTSGQISNISHLIKRKTKSDEKQLNIDAAKNETSSSKLSADNVQHEQIRKRKVDDVVSDLLTKKSEELAEKNKENDGETAPAKKICLQVDEKNEVAKENEKIVETPTPLAADELNKVADDEKKEIPSTEMETS